MCECGEGEREYNIVLRFYHNFDCLNALTVSTSPTLIFVVSSLNAKSSSAVA